jgi:hypothetical protein
LKKAEARMTESGKTLAAGTFAGGTRGCGHRYNEVQAELFFEDASTAVMKRIPATPS